MVVHKELTIELGVNSNSIGERITIPTNAASNVKSLVGASPPKLLESVQNKCMIFSRLQRTYNEVRVRPAIPAKVI